jgi:hypothetical protein
MRIAVSGTHSVGKSTFVHDFVKKYPDYIREEEPYRALCDWYDILFGKAATRYHNGIQLLYNISRIKHYHASSASVIFDRSPIDYLPYSLYPAKYAQTDIDLSFVESLVDSIRDSLKFLDIIAYVPMTDKHPIEIEDDGIRLTDPEYRQAVDDYFKEIYVDNRFNLLGDSDSPVLLEVWGSRAQRIQQLEACIASLN